MAFCAGTEGKVDPAQVTQYRPPRQEPGGMIKIFLKLENEAFEWLRTLDWKFRIGGLAVPRITPNISGLTGTQHLIHAIRYKIGEWDRYEIVFPADQNRQRAQERQWWNSFRSTTGCGMLESDQLCKQ